MVNLRSGVLGALVAISLGCSDGPTTTMQQLQPTPAWSDRIGEVRHSRDEYFRDSPETPLLPEDRASFSGLTYWEPDPDYYLVGTIVGYPHPEPIEIVTTAGQTRPCERVGWISFPIDGTEQRLQVYRLLDTVAQPGGGGFFLPFTDGTSGEETYPAGRYVELDGPQGGPYVLDFNRAHNPSCAYGDPGRFACPVTPAENRLPVRIEAGERGFREPGTPG